MIRCLCPWRIFVLGGVFSTSVLSVCVADRSPGASGWQMTYGYGTVILKKNMKRFAGFSHILCNIVDLNEYLINGIKCIPTPYLSFQN